jgi:hypothetical protein
MRGFVLYYNGRDIKEALMSFTEFFVSLEGKDIIKVQYSIAVTQ